MKLLVRFSEMGLGLRGEVWCCCMYIQYTCFVQYMNDDFNEDA